MERRDTEIAEKRVREGVFLCALCASAFHTANDRRSRGDTRRALILPVVLLVLALLGLLAGSFVFQVNADHAATQALVDKMQTRLAAEAGFQFVALLLRESLHDVDAWYDNEDKLRGVLVWAADKDLSAVGEVDQTETRERDDEQPRGPAYRFSLVADDPADDEVKVRWGLTDESSKLNINTATAEQLTRLIEQVVPPDVSAQMLAESLLDWRDSDENAGSNGAESDYYRRLEPPYRCKNAPFETVEELLMVRGFTGRVLYGEDADRNGLRSLNEDDGNLTFPPDDEDGELNRGLYPYVTAYSRAYNRANDNKPRISLAGGGSDETRAELETWFSPEEAAYLAAGPAAAGDANASSVSVFLGLASTNGTPSPFSLDDLPRIEDRCTLHGSPDLGGRINVNTAPPIVLRSLGILSEEEIAAVIQKRAAISSEAKATPAWLLTQGVLDPEKYDAIAGLITARGIQFTAEIVGFGDHTELRSRLQIVFEMRGPVPQIVYYRDLTNLGVTFPLTREDEEEWSAFVDGSG